VGSLVARQPPRSTDATADGPRVDRCDCDAANADRLHVLRESEFDLMTELVDLCEEIATRVNRYDEVQRALRNVRREIVGLVVADVHS
jgi:hypothetical protein